MSELPKDLNCLDAESAKEFLDSFDTVFCDCDGVLWVADDEIENSGNVLNYLRQLGKKLIFITNNSSKSRNEFLTKFKNMGIIAKSEEIINTAYLAAEYLHSLNFKKTAYVIGYPGLTYEMDSLGIRHTKAEPDVMNTDLRSFTRNLKFDPDVEAVVVGFDEHLSYPKLIKAVNYLKDPNCLFIATEPDETFVVDGVTLPLGACTVKALETATKRSAYVVGKPSKHIIDIVTKKYATDPTRTLMIGDNCDTDIVFGKKCGFRRLLVLSGLTSREKMVELSHSQNHDVIPDYFINKLGDLLRHLARGSTL